MAGACGVAHAQQSTTEPAQVIEVSGIRASMQSSLEQEREADTHVAVITAEDVGKMPDKNVVDSLQRVPGRRNRGAPRPRATRPARARRRGGCLRKRGGVHGARPATPCAAPGCGCRRSCRPDRGVRRAQSMRFGSCLRRVDSVRHVPLSLAARPRQDGYRTRRKGGPSPAVP